MSKMKVNRIENTATTAGGIDIDSSGNTTFGGSVTATSFAGDGSGLTGIAGAFAAGMILMYTGSSAPTGWAICDGSNGTPDLRDRFIVGSGSTYSAGSTGGYADAIIPSHSHTYEKADNMNYNNIFNAGGGRSFAYNLSYSDQNTSTVGESATGKNIPPYYALMFIMKT